MSATNEPIITDASSPFDPTAKADVILRSADFVDFAVLQYLLKLASPFFENLFGDASPDIVKDEKPVILMQEHSKVLRPLLLLLYPSAPPAFDDIDVLLEVISTSSKFCIDSEVFLGSLRHAVLISPVMQNNPHRLFAIGYRHHWTDICKAAATRSVALEVESALHRRIFGDELSHITAADLYVLMNYHREIADLALRIAREIDSEHRDGGGSATSQLQVAEFPNTIWFSSKDIPFPISFFKDHTTGCKSVLSTRKIWVYDSSNPADPDVFTVDVPAFFYDYILEVGSRFRDKPSKDTILDPGLFQKAVDKAIRDNSKCAKCREDANNIIRRLHDWTYVFARVVEDKMKEVKLNLNFS
ncbi:hypothetical protein BT96DRAFT_921815 [Gymnopus androsaceus JB14]|uniref:BTB domain-containing protein n=1 Tax=Gymnopus androsaceus JB14 TaxID=1447944 RepID=A0A6A4HEL3_9AGAR|nr:hypothetical protein BT96DRAFT_921815 [Gymnopus androsaceus JB14]